MTYWPDEWRSALAGAFDAAARPTVLEVRVLVVGNDGRYTGEVLRMGADNRREYDPTIAGQYAEGVTVRPVNTGGGVTAVEGVETEC